MLLDASFISFLTFRASFFFVFLETFHLILLHSFLFLFSNSQPLNRFFPRLFYFPRHTIIQGLLLKLDLTRNEQRLLLNLSLFIFFALPFLGRREEEASSHKVSKHFFWEGFRFIYFRGVLNFVYLRDASTPTLQQPRNLLRE
jgi:hypothetical protein